MICPTYVFHCACEQFIELKFTDLTVINRKRHSDGQSYSRSQERSMEKIHFSEASSERVVFMPEGSANENSLFKKHKI